MFFFVKEKSTTVVQVVVGTPPREQLQEQATLLAREHRVTIEVYRASALHDPPEQWALQEVRGTWSATDDRLIA